MSLRYVIARSDHPAARSARTMVRALRGASLPAPALLVRPIAAVYTAVRATYWTLKRIVLAEPWLKAHCASHGSGVRTSHFLHFFLGSGRLELGDDVLLDGKSDFVFASVLPERPRLRIGDGTYVNHGCVFVVARSVSIGRNCMLSTGVRISDSSGHPLDPQARLEHRPPPPEEIREVVIGDNVWMGIDSAVLPGVTIGEGSVVAMRSVVTKDVPPYTLVAGVPARVIRQLDRPPAAGAPAGSVGATPS